MHVLLTGGTGLIGGYLVPELLRLGNAVTLVSRSERRNSGGGVTYRIWDGRTLPDDLPQVDAVINLAGAGVADSRWTPAYKQKILSSRIEATTACAQFIRNQVNPPAVFLSASAVGYYGTAGGNRVFKESDAPGTDFLGQVGHAWEQAATGTGIRTVTPRIGIVLAKEGGAFPKLLAPFKLYAGGHIGSGEQGFPWIHVQDVVDCLVFFLQTPQAEGPINLAAPERHTNASFGKVIGRVLNRPTGLSVPSFAVKMMLGESAALVTEGQHVGCEKLTGLGYTFRYPLAEAAVRALVG